MNEDRGPGCIGYLLLAMILVFFFFIFNLLVDTETIKVPANAKLEVSSLNNAKRYARSRELLTNDIHCAVNMENKDEYFCVITDNTLESRILLSCKYYGCDKIK